MIMTCPKCGAIAEYNAYYGRITCTRCNWEGKEKKKRATILLKHGNRIYVVQGSGQKIAEA